MEEMFKKLFRGYNLTDEEVDRCSTDFTVAVLVTLIANAKEVSDTDLQKIESLWQEKRINEALETLASRYTPEEWQQYVHAHAAPLLQDYMQRVVPAET